jgi:hypothetical protein
VILNAPDSVLQRARETDFGVNALDNKIFGDSLEQKGFHYVIYLHPSRWGWGGYTKHH